MPDDRLIHKRVGHSEKLNALSDFEYIVWQAYVLSSDDFGVLRFAAAPLQADHTRLETRAAKQVQKALERVRDVGLIFTFDHQGRTYCAQHDWQDWQKIEYPRTTIQPQPPSEKLTQKTRELFAKHPGGWGKKGKGGTFPKDSPKIPQDFPEGSPTPSDETTLKPLAVSREPLATSLQPLATSREPLTGCVVAMPADHRSKRPIFKGQRLTVFEWMLDDIYRELGKSAADSLDCHEWFFTLDGQMAQSGERVPQRDGGKWLLERTVEEAQRRGLVEAPEHKSKLTLALEKASNSW